MKLIVIFFLTLFLVSCEITDFEMPSWDIDLTSIPLMNEDYPASDLEGENIIIEDGNLIAVVEGELTEASPELVTNLSLAFDDIVLLAGLDVDFDLVIQSTNTNTEIRMVEAEFATGEMELHLNSSTENYNLLTIVFEQLVHNDGSPLTLELTPNDFVNNSYFLSLAGLTLIGQDVNSNLLTLSGTVSCDSNASSGDIVGSLGFAIDEEIELNKLVGFIDQIVALDSEVDVEIDYPVNIDQAVMLDEISMYFNINNTIGFEFKLRGDLVAYKDGVEIDRIALHTLPGVDLVAHAAEIPGQVMVSTIVIDDNERVNSMLRMMPGNIALENPVYIFETEEDDEPGYISAEHTVSCDYKAEMPLKATFDDSVIIYPTQANKVEISQDNQDLIEDNVNNASIDLVLANGYPFGGTISIYISANELSEDPQDLEQAELKYLDYSIEAIESEQRYQLELSEDDLQLFTQDQVWVRTSMSFHNSNGAVAVLADDNINVKASLRISLKIEED